MVAIPEATPSRSPILGLRLKTSSQRRRAHRQAVDEELLVDQARLLHSQDLNSYKCNDYLARRKEQTENRMITDDVDDEIDEVVDAVCREKMCEWSYRVCDHFHAPRDIVAISYSYLDRFLDRCQCDRKTFKLAAMTTLYMANKTCGVLPSNHNHSTPMSIRTLANLSRGEFEMAHIAEMETILLSTLGWKVNPPTVQAFVDSLLSVIPVSKSESHHDMIYQRAIFFAELAVYDYTLVAKERPLLALVSVLNAMEGMNLPLSHFVDQVQLIFGFGYPDELIDTCRNRLWYIYGNSAQYRDEERRLMLADGGHHQQDYESPAAHSPTSKSMLQRTSSAPRSPISVIGDE